MRTDPTNLIYGLIDPRTLLIRYIGMTSNGMRRPKDHRRKSGPDSYCRRWVKKLQAQGLDYEIVVLETLKSAGGLDQAERWWIAYGRACGWPLTNLTDGGGPSEETRAEWRRREIARTRYSLEEMEAFAQRRKLKDAQAAAALAQLKAEAAQRRALKEADTAAFLAQAAAIVAPRLAAEREQAKKHEAAMEKRKAAAALKKHCFQLFEKHIGSGRVLIEVAIGARVTIEVAKRFFRQWARVSQQRAQRALKKDRDALLARWKRGDQFLTD